MAKTSRRRFDGRWFLVTGATSGLGREIARYLSANCGANVVVSGRRVDRLHTLAEEIERDGLTEAKEISADLSETGHGAHLFETVVNSVQLTGLINCAGGTFYGSVHSQDDESVRRLMELNLHNPMELSRRFVDYIGANNEGYLLNVTSFGAFVPVPYQAVYSASKHALQAYTESLRFETENRRLRISTYAPGGIDTEMVHYSGLDTRIPVDSVLFLSPERAAKQAVRVMFRGVLRGYSGPMYRMVRMLSQILPPSFVGWLGSRLYKPSL